MAITAAWGLAEIHLIGDMLAAKKCRFKLFKTVVLLNFILVAIVALIVLTLIVFIGNHSLFKE